MRKSRMHFEQIPLVVVKKIAEADVSSDDTVETSEVLVEPASKKDKQRSMSARSPRRKGR